MADELDPQGGDGGEGGGDGDLDLSALDEPTRTLVEKLNREAAAFRHERNEARDKAKTVEDQLAELLRERETDTEKTIREAEERGRTAAQAEHATAVAEYEYRLAVMAVQTAAAGRFHDPADAVAHLDLDALMAEADPGERTKAVEAALVKLLADKPYLGVQTNGAKGTLVTQGGRSMPPKSTGDDRRWLRSGRPG